MGGIRGDFTWEVFMWLFIWTLKNRGSGTRAQPDCALLCCGTRPFRWKAGDLSGPGEQSAQGEENERSLQSEVVAVKLWEMNRFGRSGG